MRSQQKEMVDRQLRQRGIKDPLVLAAMEEVPREQFVLPEQRQMAYSDGPLPIGQGQTISQPYIVAAMIEAMEVSKTDQALDIGTGSGYAAAVLSRVVERVYSIERHPDLAAEAKKRFLSLGYDNIQVTVGDGSVGWPEYAPYDAIVVTAGSPEVPDPLVDQLRSGGRLVIPVGNEFFQELVRVRKKNNDEMTRESLTAVRFVPLIGAGGWQE